MSEKCILNEVDLREAKARITELNRSLSSEAALKQTLEGLPPEVTRQVAAAIRIERDELRESINAYLTAKENGNYEGLAARAGNDIGLTLIVARVAKGLSQKELAWRLGLKAQQIQRYESERYASASIKRCQTVASVLGVNLKAEINAVLGRDLVVDDVSKPSIKKILSHGKKHGWFAQKDDVSVWREFIAGNRIEFGSPTLLRTGLNVVDMSDDILMHAWRARVVNRGRDVASRRKQKYDPAKIDWLKQLPSLSQHEDGPLRAEKLLEENGISLIVEPQIPGLKIDGAAFLDDGNPIIGMTLRRDSIDNFWFTLLHEVGHVVLHYRSGLSVGFFDQSEAESIDNIEKEADLFASNILISEEKWKRSPIRISQNEKAIARFANEIGIHPAIVFGRIRKERNKYNIFAKHIGSGKVRKLFNMDKGET
ncbi:XRE family transcriptional regulator [Nisaea sediminum]|uniref:XRE family transcriptional regulator n=1 Tax=Nisaea sediminum TaxID=2775867 RepID=UPI001866F9B5|nr:XRE family transcriptional regulator [Nisaea sediminum]